MSAWFDRVANSFIATSFTASMVLLGAASPLSAQEQRQDQATQEQQQNQPEQQPLSQQELEQLVAPIALYPDALLAQVLTASTYPLEVVMAARWSERNPKVKGAALQDAMEKQPWDPSIKGLTSVPQVLAMMSEKLDWTRQLGEAFLAQPDDIQNAVQTLRAKAEATGSLKSSKEQKVRRVRATPGSEYIGPPEYIVIEPVEPDYVYVPIYDPVTVYGVGFWSPRYVPFFWYPPWWAVGPVFGFGPALFVGPALWYSYNWGHRGFHAIQVNTTYYSKFNKVNFTGDKSWKFDPAHHKQNFKNVKLQQQFKTLDVKDRSRIGTDLKKFDSKLGVKEFKGGKIKDVNKLDTKKGLKDVKTHKEIRGIEAKTSKQLVTDKKTKEIKTHKAVKDVNTHKAGKEVTTHKAVKDIKVHKDVKRIDAGKTSKAVKTTGSIKQVGTKKAVHGKKK